MHCSAMYFPFTTWSGFLNVSVFMSLSGLTLFNFLSSLYHGPGYLPLEWMPVIITKCLYSIVALKLLFYRIKMRIKRNYNGVGCVRVIKPPDHTIVDDVSPI